MEAGGLFYDGDMWKNPRDLPYNYIPGQMEIKYFWPLTEQIPLDLDYSECNTRNLFTTSTIVPSGAVLAMNAGTGVAWTTTEFRMQENNTTMLVAKKPNLLRKLLLKLIGFKWEVK